MAHNNIHTAGITQTDDLVTARNNLWNQYLALSTTPLTSYSLPERQIQYETRKNIFEQVQKLNKMIAVRNGSCKGFNLATFTELS